MRNNREAVSGERGFSICCHTLGHEVKLVAYCQYPCDDLTWFSLYKYKHNLYQIFSISNSFHTPLEYSIEDFDGT